MRKLLTFISSAALISLMSVSIVNAQTSTSLTGEVSVGAGGSSVSTGSSGHVGASGGSVSGTVSGSGSASGHSNASDSGSASAAGDANASDAHGNNGNGNASADVKKASDTASGSSISLELTSRDASSANLDDQGASMTANSVVSPGDLDRFATASMKHDANIESISATDHQLTIAYRVPGHFLGLIPASLTARTVVNADGSVAIHYPWYRFLFSVPNAVSSDALRAQVQGTLLADVNGSFDPISLAQLIEGVRNAFTGSVSAEASGSATGNMTGSAASTTGSGAATSKASAAGSASGSTAGTASTGY